MSHPHRSEPPRVLPMTDWRRTDRDRLAGKAMGLVLLRECGCPVPDAFGITADAFREHLARAVPADNLDVLAAPQERRRSTAFASIRDRIGATPMDRDLARQVEAAFRALPEGSVAVRSSSLSEDGADAAFAGLHDPRLNVTDLAACLEAIRNCWASMFTDRAIVYRVVRAMITTVVLCNPPGSRWPRLGRSGRSRRPFSEQVRGHRAIDGA